MRQTDVAIVGGGLAGSIAAAMLGRAGVDAVLIDPHPVYPPDFRCEKLDPSQVKLLRTTGLADRVLRASTRDEEVWVARFGHLLDRKPNGQYDLLYDTFVAEVRAQIPSTVPFLHAKATSVATGSDRQRLAISTGEEISARLVVMANGLNSALRQTFGMTRRDISLCHSVGIGFDLRAAGPSNFRFKALTYYPESRAERIAYLTLFPIGSSMRANMFVYRDMNDLWLRELRHDPVRALCAALPGLRKITGDFEVTGAVKIRPVDLYVTENVVQPGIVLAGDAFATSCPAAGTGVNKVITDVERLCTEHIPRWLSTDGMGEQKIAEFYADPAKRACDEHSHAKAFYLRSLSIDTGLVWRQRRLRKFVLRLGAGMARKARSRLTSALVRQPPSAAGSSFPG